MSKADELVQDGWTQQATYDEPRLSEMVEAYQSLGFEVRIEPVEVDGSSGCSECMALRPERFKTLYTRKVEEE